jgi:probable rRNA maturation factor
MVESTYLNKLITFNSIDVTSSIQGKKEMVRWLNQVINNEGMELGFISISFCSDKHLLEINKSALQHNYYTDIITFQLNEKNEAIEGDLYISIDRVKDNAKTLGIKWGEELKRVIIHGVLHLCGYKDKTKKDIELMRKKENECLSLLQRNNYVSRGTK